MRRAGRHKSTRLSPYPYIEECADLARVEKRDCVTTRPMFPIRDKSDFLVFGESYNRVVRDLICFKTTGLSNNFEGNK